MNWNNFKPMFHPSWHNKMKPFIESNECDEIYAFLKKESKRGKQIAPLSTNVYKCFKETSLDDIKFIMMGMCPNHIFKNNLPIADGLLLGCSITEYIEPSLENFYKALEKEFNRGLNLNYDPNPDVTYLAKQGVLMLNAALTTEKNKAGSHTDVWESFIKYLFEEIFNSLNIPILFLGKDVNKYKKYTGIFSHVFTVGHPASASYKGADWDSEGVFTKIDTLIYENNGYSINWLKDAEDPF